MTARKLLFTALQSLLMLLLTMALLEASLRLFPRLIPPFLLVDFNPGAREQIAGRLDLPTEKTVRLLPRDDGGPPGRMRLFRPMARIALDIPDPGFVRAVVMDADGFCNPPRQAAGSSSAELVALGDSFTYCTGVRPEDTWPVRLGGLLDLSPVNLGSPGIGPYEYLQVLKQFGIPKKPRVVVLNLYEGNDLRDAMHFLEYRQAVGQGKQAPVRRLLKERPLARSSYAYNLVVVGARRIHHETRHLLARWVGVPDGEEPEPDFRYSLRFPEGEVAFNRGNVDVDEVRAARALRTGQIDPGILGEGLSEFVEMAKRHRFAPVVAYTPSAYSAYADFVAFRDPTLGELMPWFSRRQREYLARKGVELGYTFVDLTPAMQAAARESRGSDLLYFPTILHLTARGHAAIASALARALRGASGDDRISAGKADSTFRPAARMGHP